MERDSLTGVPLTPAAIPGIQPGGGFCHGLALWCGRLRRAFLGRPADPPGDPKWHRNAGHNHPPGGEPLFTAHPLRLARAGWPEVVVFTRLLGTLTAEGIWLALAVHPAFWVLAGIALGLWVFVMSFFRDPERADPADPHARVSPADGTITDVGEVAEPDFPGGRAFRVGIFLSVFNVHINRIPRAGRVLGVRYFPGRFLDARAAGCEKVNEQLWIDLGEGPAGRLVRVKQIAGAIARRIVCWLRPGEEVPRGMRLGMIKFGSRTEVYVPTDAVKEVLVKVGDTVKGASSVLLRVGDQLV
jgi:phosphatidylserine decarboxylase